jgi:pyruvate ferredoxin oxidoreductase gamma subunit
VTGVQTCALPIYVRAARAPIHERGVIRVPDLVVVADDSLVPVPAAGVMQGLSARTVLLLVSATDADTWRSRLNFAGPLLTLPPGPTADAEARHAGAACAGAAARLTGAIARDALAAALRAELAAFGDAALGRNLDQALAAWDALADRAGIVAEGGGFAATGGPPAEWIEPPLDTADAGAAAIHAGANSVQVRTGLWRTLRPVADLARCKHCWWVCSAFCPDSAIRVGADGTPQIDYDHCKGCMICVAQCPAHAIAAVPESEAAA